MFHVERIKPLLVSMFHVERTNLLQSRDVPRETLNNDISATNAQTASSIIKG